LETNSQKLFEGHEAPVLSVALDPKHKYIASSSCDSSVKIWNSENQNCVHFWDNCYPKSNDFENSQTLARISWEPINGQLIAIPKSDQIDVYQRESWDLVKSYKHEKLSQISIVTYSYDGNYLAAATNSGTVLIWETKTTNSDPIAIFFHNKSIKITSLKWNPKVSKQLCFCDINGQFGILNIKVSSNKTETKDSNMTFTQQEVENMFADLSDDDFGSELNDITDQNSNNKIDLELPKIEFNFKSRKTVAKQVEIVDNINDTNEDNNNDDNDDNEFDIGAIKSQYESQIFGDIDNDFDKVEVRENTSRPVSRTSQPLVEREPEEPPPLRQEPFQSGSTPIHYKQRFMVWNSVGIVRSYNTEDENSIDVEFHDTTYHHSIHLSNVHNYTIADLSTDCLVLATNGDETAQNSKLFCMLFSTWDATKEWQIEMPKDEYIDAITCGSGFIAIATDKRFVRIFTTGGIQTNIFSIAGPVLCVSSHEQFLMIIYHMASGMPEEQSLSMYILRADHKSGSKHPVPNPIPVALSPKSQVLWAGFTDEGTPCVVDYDGVVRLFKGIIGNSWIPIASTKESVSFIKFSLNIIQAFIEFVSIFIFRLKESLIITS
jgi:chromosome transmission fidelity protein 4